MISLFTEDEIVKLALKTLFSLSSLQRGSDLVEGETELLPGPRVPFLWAAAGEEGRLREEVQPSAQTPPSAAGDPVLTRKSTGEEDRL